MRNEPARRRWGLFLLTMVPVAALLGLLVWGLVQSGGNPGGLQINAIPGEEPINVKAAPTFEVSPLRGGAVVSNGSLAGKVVLIDFWSSWCPPCQAEAARLVEVYSEYGEQPIEFVGIAIWDETRDVLAHMDRFGVTYPNGLDVKGELAINFGVRGVPEKYFLRPDGTLAMKFTGPMPADRLRETLSTLLADEHR